MTDSAPALKLEPMDRSSPVPLYFQVAQQLETAIADGVLPPGSRLDNELLLAAQLGLSRPTMRRAMQHLVDKGLIVRRRGIGTRVVQPAVRRSLELSSLFDDLAGSNQQPRTDVLALAVEPGPDDVTAALGLAPGQLVISMVRLRHAGTQPIARMTNHLPTDLPDLSAGLTREALETSGLYQIIRSAGIHLHAATQAIGARAATAEEARLLDERRGAALLTMQRTAYDDHGRAIEFSRHVYAASRYSFEMSLLAP